MKSEAVEKVPNQAIVMINKHSYRNELLAKKFQESNFKTIWDDISHRMQESVLEELIRYLLDYEKEFKHFSDFEISFNKRGKLGHSKNREDAEQIHKLSGKLIKVLNNLSPKAQLSIRMVHLTKQFQGPISKGYPRPKEINFQEITNSLSGLNETCELWLNNHIDSSPTYFQKDPERNFAIFKLTGYFIRGLREPAPLYTEELINTLFPRKNDCLIASEISRRDSYKMACDEYEYSKSK